jgi:hypothetical protein
MQEGHSDVDHQVGDGLYEREGVYIPVIHAPAFADKLLGYACRVPSGAFAGQWPIWKRLPELNSVEPDSGAFIRLLAPAARAFQAMVVVDHPKPLV